MRVVSGTLNKNKIESEPFEWEGFANILITGGMGTVTLMRKLGDSDYYPYSISMHEVAEFEADGGLVYNGFVESQGNNVTFKLVADLSAGQIEYSVCRGG